MKMRSLAFIPLLALALTGLVACGGNKSSNANATNGPMTVATGAMNAAHGAMNAAHGAMGAAAGAAGAAAGAMGANASMPNCGAVKPVWVNLKTMVYHEPNDPYYGKTKHGEYLCPSQAKAQGFHPAGAMSGHHGTHGGNTSSDDSSM